MISTRGRYALRVMIDLAQQNSDDYIPLSTVAARQEISAKYLQQIVKVLVEEKMLTGISGKGGGYKLTRRPEEYSVGEILELMEGTLAPVSCLAADGKECSRYSTCKTLPMWRQFDKMVHDFFAHITIADLVNGTFDF
ncbi:MAG: Rrf2 family transcriptional regulator [Clostridium sp.]|nr:Rrf2 family transcriptional regulator [Lachnoclostridium sp.]MCM1252208.1 Rrf2 family transcriptional regulator [Clostridium sp.]